MRRTALALGAIAWCATAVAAQESSDPRRAGRRQLLPRAEEIALARSGAPASVADSASIFVFTDSGFVLAERGTNGAACYVSRSWPSSIEPHCFDAEGAASIMRIHMREVELLHRGLTPKDAEREIAPDIMSGKLRLPARPAISWMFSAEQKLISDSGQPAGRWRPHIMIYYPYLAAMPGGDGAPDFHAGMVSGAGTAQSRETNHEIALADSQSSDSEPWRAPLNRIDVERALASLAPGFREVLVLHDVEGYTHEDIAIMLGVQPGTSKSQLSRARAAMRRALGESPTTEHSDD